VGVVDSGSLLYLSGFYFLRAHFSKYNVHDNDDEYNHGHGRPKADVEPRPFGCSEKYHPEYLPIHHCVTS
jgi:hypothetical protein